MKEQATKALLAELTTTRFILSEKKQNRYTGKVARTTDAEWRYLAVMTIFLLSISSSIFAAYTPLDTVSVEEIKYVFYETKEERMVDTVSHYTYREQFEVGNEPGLSSFVNSSTMKIKGKTIPPSVWKMSIVPPADSKSPKISTQKVYQWVRPLSFLEKPDKEMKKRIVSAYDKTLGGLPADAFVGYLFSIGKPIYYNGFLIAGVLKEGIINQTKGARGSTYSKRGSLSFAIWKRNLGTDGPWYRGYQPPEVILFEHDVNRLYKEDTIRGWNNSYTFLIQIDSIGKCHLHTLLPKKLSEKDKQRVAKLSPVIEEQPAWIFGSLYTIDGRVYPARIINAVYWGGEEGWTFRDPYFEPMRFVFPDKQKK